MDLTTQRIACDSIKKSLTTVFSHKEYRIPFPFNPYNVQKELMSTILDALDNRQNALLESPTGTGKTLCILTSLLTWLNAKQSDFETGKEKIKVIYLSRTHHQLKQVVRQIRKTCFIPNVVTASSRDHACVNPEVNERKGHDLEVQCRKRVRKQNPSEQEEQRLGCHYYENVNSQLFKQRFAKPVIRDLEQLKEHATCHDYCPFFLNREPEVRNNADIILMPYNYLLDRNSFGIYSADVPNSIVVFDEAHNVQNVACDGQSFRITFELVKQSLQELANVIREHSISQKRNMESEKITADSLNWLASRTKIFAGNFYSFKESKLKSGSDFDNGVIVFGETLLSWLRELFLVSSDTKSDLMQILSDMIDLQGLIMTEFPTVYNWNIDRLCGFLALARRIQRCGEQAQELEWDLNLLNHYRLLMKEQNDVLSLELWCMDSALAFQQIRDLSPYNIILTSGTLSPLGSWPMELGIPFEKVLSNPHVIKPEQLLVACIKKNKELMNFDYNNRNNKAMLADFGDMLLRISQTVPNGVLVMFSSYSLLNSMKQSLYDAGLWNAINSNKYIYEEPKEQSKLADTLTTYGKMAHTKKGAFMFAVFRGKISEGIDLSDELCRAVVVVGVPFPPTKDLKIVNKKEYLTTKCQKLKNKARQNTERQLDGTYWYSLQTMRAVNQAIGRVIRHVKDYGAIFFFDQRYDTHKQLRGMISKWAQERFEVAPEFEKLMQRAASFYERNEKTLGKERMSVEPSAIIEIEDDDNRIQLKPKRLTLMKDQTFRQNSSQGTDQGKKMQAKLGLSVQKRQRTHKESGNRTITSYFTKDK